MRFALRTLVPVFAATVVVTTTTAFLPRPAVAQDAAAKSDAAPAKDAAAPAADSTTAAPAAEAVDPKPLLEKGEAALKASDYAAAMAAFNEAGKVAQQASQAGGGADMLKAQAMAAHRPRPCTNRIEGIRSRRKRLPQHSPGCAQRRARPHRHGSIETRKRQAGRSDRPISKTPSRLIQQTAKRSSATASRWSSSAAATKPSRRSRA